MIVPQCPERVILGLQSVGMMLQGVDFEKVVVRVDDSTLGPRRIRQQVYNGTVPRDTEARRHADLIV